MAVPTLTRIGEPQRTIRDVPMPVPVRRRMVPIPKPKEPEKEPIWVRPVREPEKVPSRQALWNSVGLEIEEIPYYCPDCGREMEMEDGTLYCPTHGVVYE